MVAGKQARWALKTRGEGSVRGDLCRRVTRPGHVIDIHRNLSRWSCWRWGQKALPVHRDHIALCPGRRADSQSVDRVDDMANLKSSTVRRGACESEDKSLLNNGKRSSKRPGPAAGTGPVKQRGGLTAATETLGQFDLTMPAPATPLLWRVCSGDA